MPKPNTGTISALNAFRNGNTQRWTAAALGLDDSWRGTVHRILHGYEVGRDTENTIRLALGLPALPRITEAIACPSCGIVHGEGLDCGGAAGDVAWVKPDQRIAKRSKPREYKAIASMPVNVLAWKIKNKEAIETW